MTVLLCGMMLDSAAFPVGSGAYIALTVVLGFLLVGVVATFLGLLVFEVWQSLRFSLAVRSGGFKST